MAKKCKLLDNKTERVSKFSLDYFAMRVAGNRYLLELPIVRQIRWQLQRLHHLVFGSLNDNGLNMNAVMNDIQNNIKDIDPPKSRFLWAVQDFSGTPYKRVFDSNFFSDILKDTKQRYKTLDVLGDEATFQQIIADAVTRDPEFERMGLSEAEKTIIANELNKLWPLFYVLLNNNTLGGTEEQLLKYKGAVIPQLLTDIMLQKPTPIIGRKKMTELLNKKLWDKNPGIGRINRFIADWWQDGMDKEYEWMPAAERWSVAMNKMIANIKPVKHLHIAAQDLYRVAKMGGAGTNAAVLMYNAFFTNGVLYKANSQGIKTLHNNEDAEILTDFLIHKELGIVDPWGFGSAYYDDFQDDVIRAGMNPAESIGAAVSKIHLRHNSLFNIKEEDSKLAKVFKFIPHMMTHGGPQNLAEIIFAKRVQKMAVMEALAGYGPEHFRQLAEAIKNKKNVIEAAKKSGTPLTDEVLRGLDNDIQMAKLSMPPDVINEIAARMKTYQARFFPSGNDPVALRTVMSRFLIFNMLQSYVNNRAIDVLNSGVQVLNWMKKKTHNMYSSNKVPVESFAELSRKYPEIMQTFLATIYAAKIGTYAYNHFENEENEHADYKDFLFGLNDHIGSFKDANLIASLFGGITKRHEAMKNATANGMDVSNPQYLEWQALGALDDLYRRMYKELDIYKVGGALFGTLNNGGSFGDALTAMEEEWDRSANAISNYTFLQPNYLGMQRVPQADDYLFTATLSMGETNKSVKEYNMAMYEKDLAKFLEGSKKSILKDLPLADIYFRYADYEEKGENQLGVTYRKLLSHVKTDEVIQNLYKGEFDKRVFLNMDGTIDEKAIDETYLKLIDWSSYQSTERLKGTQADGSKLYPRDQYVYEQGKKLITEKFWINWDEFTNQMINYKDPSKITNLNLMLAMAEENIPWATAAIISHMANVEKGQLRVAEVGYKKNENLEDGGKEMDQRHKLQLIEKYYPYFSYSDKAAWYNLVQQRLAHLDPEAFQKTKEDGTKQNSPGLSNYIGTAGFLNYMVHNELERGNVDATKMSNLFMLGLNGIKNDAHKLALLNGISDKINTLPTDQESKQAMRMGVTLASIESLMNIDDSKVKDPNMKEVLHSALSNVFQNNEHVNLLGLNYLKEDNAESQKQYGKTSGKKYGGKSYTRNAYNRLQNDMNNLTNKYGNGNNYSNNGNSGYTGNNGKTATASTYPQSSVYNNGKYHEDAYKDYYGPVYTLSSSYTPSIKTENRVTGPVATDPLDGKPGAKLYRGHWKAKAFKDNSGSSSSTQKIKSSTAYTKMNTLNIK